MTPRLRRCPSIDRLPRAALVLVLWPVLAAAQNPAPRVIHVDTRESTQLTFDVSPDGQWLIIDLLGQLWRLPAAGGDARPLTDAARDTAEDLDPTLSPDGQWIAFQSDRPAGRGVWLMPAGGGTPRLLVAAEDDRTWPAWSPDGRRLALVRNGGLAIADVASASITELRITGPPSAAAREPAWTPDGRRIVFVNAQRYTSIGGAIWQVAHTGGLATQVGGPELRVLAPALSRQGRIAFFLRDTLTIKHELWIADSLGAPPRRVTDEPDMSPLRVRWTPDGESLIYHANGQLWRLGVRDSVPERIPLHATLDVVIRPWSAPAVRLAAPGTRLAARGFRSLQLSPDARRIAVIALDTLWLCAPGERPRALIGVPQNAEDLAWSWDARRLAWSAGPQRDIYVTDVTTGSTSQLTALPDDEFRPAWSPDGRFVAFLHGQPGWREHRLRVVRADTGEPVKTLEETRDLGADPYGRYLSSDNMGQEILHWTHDAAAVLFLDPATQKFLRLQVAGGTDTLSHPIHNATFLRLLSDTLLFFIRDDQLFSAAFDARSGAVGDPRLRADVALYPSVALDGTVLYVAPDGLTLLTPRGERRRLGWPLSYRTPSASPLLLRKVVVLDLEAGQLTAPRDILIRDGRIARVAPTGVVRVAPHIRQVDAGGRIAIPGPIDLHQHFWDDAQAGSAIRFGITTTRDLGSALAATAALRDAVEAGVRPGPRILLGGLTVRTTSQDRYGWSGQYSQALVNREAVPRGLDLLRSFDAHYLKLFQFGRWSDAVETIGHAHARGLRVTGHIAHPLPLAAAAVDGKEHTGRAGGYHRADGIVYEDIVQLFRGAAVAVVPTLSVFGGATRMYDDPTLLSGAESRAFLSPYLEFWAMNFPSPTRDPAQRRNWERIREVMRAAARRLHAGGVRLGAGTDAPFPPWAVHWELEELVASGLNPVEALRAAAFEAARILGIEGLGRIAEGSTADILLLDGNPLQDIRNTRLIWMVIKGGRIQ
ncbi:MAG: amidohydrolase family protein [Armatimonadota bacterium]